MTTPAAGLPAQASAASQSADPLAYPLFRAIWIATIASNIGSWMMDAGSGWLMTSMTTEPLLVAMIQAATTLPIFFLAAPAGALADIVDRRRLLITAQLLAVTASAALAASTLMGWTTPMVLLAIAAALGCATAMSAPAFQAIVPELVASPALPQAVAMNSLGVNIARAIGPALGGVTIAFLGPAAVFACDAVLTLAVVAVLLRWRRVPTTSHLPSETVGGAIIAGFRYARGSPALLAVLARALIFFLFSSPLLALLPLMGRRVLGLDAGHYGLLLAAMGVGAVAGALVLRRLGGRAKVEALTTAAGLVLGAAMIALALSRSLPLAMAAMFVGGAAWIATLSTLNSAAQRVTPAWVRARSLALYLVASQGAMAIGAILWGTVATRTGVPAALMLSAAGLLISTPLARLIRLPAALDLAPGGGFSDPGAQFEPEPDKGPVMILVEYRVAPERRTAFEAAMSALRTIRRRDGAFSWLLLEDVAEPGLFVESFLVASWLEHLRQHARGVHEDETIRALVHGLHEGDQPPRVRHLTPGLGLASHTHV